MRSTLEHSTLAPKKVLIWRTGILWGVTSSSSSWHLRILCNWMFNIHCDCPERPSPPVEGNFAQHLSGTKTNQMQDLAPRPWFALALPWRFQKMDMRVCMETPAEIELLLKGGNQILLPLLNNIKYKETSKSAYQEAIQNLAFVWKEERILVSGTFTYLIADFLPLN